MSSIVKILITGGAGYIGSILTPMLIEHGYQVTVLDNFIFRQSSLLELCINPRFRVIRGDCRNAETMKDAMRNADIVIPLAALVGAPLCKRDEVGTITTNLEAVKLILSLRSADQHILYPCTNSGYGIGERDKYCTEESPLNPISLYGRTKVEAEKAILDAGNSISFRLATVFGTSPRMRLDLLVNDFVYRALIDRFVVIFEGNFKRNYVHVRDVARVFLHGIQNFDRMKNEPYNVGLSDANLSKLELCAEIQKQIPDFVFLEAPVGQDPDKRDYIISNEKVEKTGFKPIHSLEKGILELVKGYTILRNTLYTNV